MGSGFGILAEALTVRHQASQQHRCTLLLQTIFKSILRQIWPSLQISSFATWACIVWRTIAYRCGLAARYPTFLNYFFPAAVTRERRLPNPRYRRSIYPGALVFRSRSLGILPWLNLVSNVSRFGWPPLVLLAPEVIKHPSRITGGPTMVTEGWRNGPVISGEED